MQKIISKYYAQFLLIILAFSFFTRIYRLNIPEKYIFDEVYHAVTAKLIANNDIRAYEWSNPPPEPNTAVDWLHPPIAKYFQALSIKLFSPNSFGWRFSSVIFGVLAIFLTAKLALNLFKNKSLALMAALITSLDGLVLTMSRIAMNDIHVTVFILMSLNFYTIYINKKRKKILYLVLASLSAGLAMGTKWSGLFALLTIIFFESLDLINTLYLDIKTTEKIALLIKNKKIISKKIKNGLKKTITLFLILLVLPSLIYILSYSQMFMLGKDFKYFIELHKNILWYQTTLEATHPAQSTPIQWFFNTKPVWFDVSWKENMRGDIYAVGNPTLFWFGDAFIFVSLVYLLKLIKESIKKKKATKILKRFFLFLFFYFALWLPWQVSPRIMFFYHYLPAVPILSINMAFWLNKLFSNTKIKNIKLIPIIILLIIFITFIVWYPHWVDIRVPGQIKNNLYFYFDFWKQG